MHYSDLAFFCFSRKSRITEKFEVKIFLGRVTRLEYFSALARIKYDSARLKHYVARLLRLRLPGLTQLQFISNPVLQATPMRQFAVVVR